MAQELTEEQLRALPSIRCHLCRVDFPGSELDAHADSPKHVGLANSRRIDEAIRKVFPWYRPCPGPVGMLSGNPAIS